MTTIASLPSIYEPERFEYSRVLFKECAVAGVSFHIERGDELWDELSEGTKVALVRDRNNKHDRNAVAIALADDYDGDPDNFDFDFILGYVPRTENAELAAMLDAGYYDKFDAEITTFRRHGNYDERIRITIWLTTNKPIRVRPDLLRADSLDYEEFLYFLDGLKQRGVAYMRYRWFPPENNDLPVKGEKIVILSRHMNKVYMYLMKVLAEGDACAIYFEDPTEIHCCDDCAPFILGNIAGPVVVDIDSLSFIPMGELERLSVHFYLIKPISNSLKEIFDSQTRCFSLNNIDADPSIDEPLDTEEDYG